MATPTHKHFSDAVLMGDVGRVWALLQEPHTVLDLNRPTTDDGQTALHRSCSAGNLDLVKLLIAYGADPRRKNEEGWTALHLSVFNGHRRITSYLLQVLHDQPKLLAVKEEIGDF